MAPFVAAVAAANLNVIKRLLANGLSAFPIKGSRVCRNSFNVYLKIHVLSYFKVFYSFILLNEPFANTIRSALKLVYYLIITYG